MEMLDVITLLRGVRAEIASLQSKVNGLTSSTIDFMTRNRTLQFEIQALKQNTAVENKLEALELRIEILESLFWAGGMNKPPGSTDGDAKIEAPDNNSEVLDMSNTPETTHSSEIGQNTVHETPVEKQVVETAEISTTQSPQQPEKIPRRLKRACHMKARKKILEQQTEASAEDTNTEIVVAECCKTKRRKVSQKGSIGQPKFSERAGGSTTNLEFGGEEDYSKSIPLRFSYADFFSRNKFPPMKLTAQFNRNCDVLVVPTTEELNYVAPEKIQQSFLPVFSKFYKEKRMTGAKILGQLYKELIADPANKAILKDKNFVATNVHIETKIAVTKSTAFNRISWFQKNCTKTIPHTLVVCHACLRDADQRLCDPFIEATAVPKLTEVYNGSCELRHHYVHKHRETPFMAPSTAGDTESGPQRSQTLDTVFAHVKY